MVDFIVPLTLIPRASLGQYFHDLYNKTLDDLNHSKAKLIADLSKQIELNCQHKLQDLQKQLEETTRTAQDVARKAEQAEQETRQLSDRLARTKAVIAVLATLVTLIVLFFIFKSK